MYSAHQNPGNPIPRQAHDPATMTFRVDDMTCGHCAGTIKKAIETSLPGTTVSADPTSKLVSVTGAGSYAQLKEIVSTAGYTVSTEEGT